MLSADAVVFEWRGSFTNLEVNSLHAEAFETRLFDESEWNWRELTARHSLGWVTARRGATNACTAATDLPVVNATSPCA